MLGKSTSNLILHNELNESNLEHDFLECLHHRKIHPKFLDWGDKEFERWQTLCKTKSFLYHQRESTLLQRAVGPILKTIYKELNTHYNVLNMGMDTNAPLLLKELLSYNQFHYVPIAMNDGMVVKVVEENIPPDFGQIDAYIKDYLDFSTFAQFSQRLRKEKHAHHFIPFLGNRIGYLNNIDMLTRIQKGLMVGDYMLFGICLQKKGDVIVQSAQMQKIVDMFTDPLFEHFVLSPLERIGVTQAHGDLEVVYGPGIYSPYHNKVEIFFIFHGDKTVFYGGEELHFAKDGRIRLMKMAVYTEETFERMMEVYGFNVVEKHISSDRMVGLYLCNVQK